MTSISKNTFYGCLSLTSIAIPNSVTSIGDNALYGCGGLTSIVIPNNVTSIGSSAFSRCGLTEVYCLADNVPSTNDKAFYGSAIKSATLYVPQLSVDVYSETSPWSKFGTIIGLTQDEIDGIEEIKDDSLTPALSKGEGEWYDLSGRKTNSLPSGRSVGGHINIVRHSDGTTRKVMVK